VPQNVHTCPALIPSLLPTNNCLQPCLLGARAPQVVKLKEHAAMHRPSPEQHGTYVGGSHWANQQLQSNHSHNAAQPSGVLLYLLLALLVQWALQRLGGLRLPRNQQRRSPAQGPQTNASHDVFSHLPSSPKRRATCQRRKVFESTVKRSVKTTTTTTHPTYGAVRLTETCVPGCLREPRHPATVASLTVCLPTAAVVKRPSYNSHPQTGYSGSSNGTAGIALSGPQSQAPEGSAASS